VKVKLVTDQVTYLELEPRTWDWHEFRRNGIGGSDIGPIYLGENWPYKRISLTSLISEKAGLNVEEIEETFAMKKGSRLEDVAIAEFTHRTGIVPFRKFSAVSADHPWLRCSLDGIYFEGEIPRPIEVKYTPLSDHHAAALHRQVPDHYRPQLEWIMMVLDCPSIEYLSINDSRQLDEQDTVHRVRVERDLGLQAKLLQVATQFWELVEQKRREVGVA
jgi:putative phage-type endonuclease